MMKNYKLWAVFLMALMLASTVPAVSAASNYSDGIPCVPSPVIGGANFVMHVEQTGRFIVPYDGDEITGFYSVYDPEYFQLVRTQVLKTSKPDKDGIYGIILYKVKALKEGKSTIDLGYTYYTSCFGHFPRFVRYSVTVIPKP